MAKIDLDKDVVLAERIGAYLVEFLNLKSTRRKDLFRTEWGTKTRIGLARSIWRIFNDQTRERGILRLCKEMKVIRDKGRLVQGYSQVHLNVRGDHIRGHIATLKVWRTLAKSEGLKIQIER